MFTPALPGPPAVNSLSVVLKDRFPIAAPRIDLKFADQQLDDVLEEDASGRKVQTALIGLLVFEG